MNQEREDKIVRDLESLAQALVENQPAGSRLAVLGRSILILCAVNPDPVARAQAEQSLKQVSAPEAESLERLLQDLGVRLN